MVSVSDGGTRKKKASGSDRPGERRGRPHFAAAPDFVVNALKPGNG